MQLKLILEALLVAAPGPLTLRKLAEITGIEERDARRLVSELKEEYDLAGRAIEIREVAGGYKIYTRPEYAPYVEKLFPERRPPISQAALETLAIVAYRQPITRAELEAIRGVKVSGVLDHLLESKLVVEVGRKMGPGRPILYGTGRGFLQYFGLNDLKELPPLGA